MHPRIVVDTNALVSRLLLPSSVSARAVRKAVDSSILLVSEATMNELADVLARPKFDRYISLKDRQQFLRLLGRLAEFVTDAWRMRAPDALAAELNDAGDLSGAEPG